MGLDGGVDRLIGRIALFESWYMDGYSGLMADLNMHCSRILKKDFKQVSEKECRSSIETILSRLEDHYTGIPYHALEADVFCSYISVIDELWESYKPKIKPAVSGDYANEGELGVEDRSILRTCEGISRCVTLGQADETAINYIKTMVPLVREGTRIIQLYPEMGKDLAGQVTGAVEDMSQLFKDIMAGRYCDRDVAPLVVSKYIVQDLAYCARDFLANGNLLSYIEVWELAAAASQVNELFRTRFSATLDRLHMIPGYESFQTEVRDVDGSAIRYHDLLWENKRNG